MALLSLRRTRSQNHQLQGSLTVDWVEHVLKRWPELKHEKLPGRDLFRDLKIEIDRERKNDRERSRQRARESERGEGREIKRNGERYRKEENQKGKCACSRESGPVSACRYSTKARSVSCLCRCMHRRYYVGLHVPHSPLPRCLCQLCLSAISPCEKKRCVIYLELCARQSKPGDNLAADIIMHKKKYAEYTVNRC